MTQSLPTSDVQDPPINVFNPFVALQSLLSAETVSLPQRVKAAEQLEAYFRSLSPTPGLLLSYEPYLLLLTEVMVTSVHGCLELQTSVLSMLQALSSHNPSGFGDWIAMNTHVGNESWLMQWSYALVLQTEKQVPRKNDGTWNEVTTAMTEFDRMLTRVLHMWRTLLDYTDDGALVDQVVKYLQALLVQQTHADQWQTLLLKRLQTHFVDIADVLIGWMMSVEPNSLLREEILSLLHRFGRLWTDNSVFSLQLLNSFADEIINICDSRSDHREGDDDRLNMLLVSFTMVASCVPDLALHNNGDAESPFEKVLHSLVSCTQPYYSLFCLANCSEYLVVISNCKRSQFPPLSVATVRFLLYHCAVQSQMHDSELDKLSTVVKNACQLASTNFHDIKDPCLVQTMAVGVLQDEISSRNATKGKQSERLKAMECVFRLHFVTGIAYVSQLCLELVWIGGISALKVLGEQAVKHLSDHYSEEVTSYSVFAATCFILASANTKRLRFTRDDEMLIMTIFDLVTTQLEIESHRFQQDGSTPRQLYLVLKMACTFTSAVSRSMVTQSYAVNNVNGVCLRLLECAANLVPTEDVVVRNHRLWIGVLNMIEAVLSERKLIPTVPHEVFRRLIRAGSILLHCSSVKVREKCLPVFKMLASRAEARAFAVNLLETCLDLLLDSSQSVRDQVESLGLSDIALWALVNNDKEHVIRHVSQKLCPSFNAADFEEMIGLFQTSKCSVTEWNRVCRRIVDRAACDGVFGNGDVLLYAVHQAAEWCVQNRLRTHFGGPSQTFECIEGMLQEYSNRIQSMSGSTGRANELHVLSHWLLLEFVAALEMRIARASRSTEVAQCNPESEQYKSALFFRTNKMVCDDWLTRIRPLLVKISKDGSSYELCRYHSHALMAACYNKLGRVISSFPSRNVSKQMYEELRQAEKDMDAALFSLCRCHIDAKDADSIIGFQKWSQSISSTLWSLYQQNEGIIDPEKDLFEKPPFRWLDAMRLDAQMSYEDAAAQYELLLQPIIAQARLCSSKEFSVVRMFESPIQYVRMSPVALLGCFEQCAKCYAYLHEWTKLRGFVLQFIEIAQSLVDYNHHIEGFEAILECSDRWRDEIDVICNLEPEGDVFTGNLENEIKMNLGKGVTRMLREWCDTPTHAPDTKLPSTHLSNLIGHFQCNLIPLALQPSPWNGYAGDNIGKRAERSVIRSFRISETSEAMMHETETLTGGIRLNSEMHDSAAWSQLFCIPRPAESADSVSLQLISVARLARKQCNFSIAQNLLEEVEASKGASQSSLMVVSYEKGKLLEAKMMEQEGLHILESQCESSLRSIEMHRDSREAEVTARSLLRLGTKLARAGSTSVLSPTTCSFLNTLMATLANQEVFNDINTQDILLTRPQDAAAHKCLLAAIALSPRSAKAFFRYGHWCYDQGNQLLARIEEQGGYFLLESSDKAALNAILNEIGIPESNRELIVRSFCHFSENGERISQNFDYIRQVCSERASQSDTTDALNRLVQLQQACHSKLFRFYSMSARSYGKYLKALFSDSEYNIPKQQVTLVTLRLLSLLTTYGAESDIVSGLEEVFIDGPVTPWSFIVPQLIARVHHPVTAAASFVRILLKRLAHHSPHAIVYPIVMNSIESQVKLSKERDDEMDNAFVAVLHELQNVSHGQVDGVWLLVSELRRVSVLWDEVWCSLLMKLAADISRRNTTLEKEAARLSRNAALSTINKSELAHRKLVAIMKPVLLSIENLWKETCGRAGDQHQMSPHERKFLKDYGGLIERAIKSFRDYCASEMRAWTKKTAYELWHPFAEVLKALVKTTGRRELVPLHEISPAMASNSRELSHATMPGVSFGQTTPITIARVIPSVGVLKTKTKPKSLEFLGSDGKAHKYLLKAREDLRLDERIMQFLQVTNECLRANDAAAARDLSAQHYSVIPISSNAGLIQMVPDVVPLFQVYASRYEHQANEQISQENVASFALQAPSPTAQFYAKLKQHGIVNVSPNNRAEWPMAVLKQVYQELVARRPRNVLLQEILLRSQDLRESWTKSRRFSKSLAVMSVLGYIIGLGDRHLDNILLCINSGEIVHIDYNVCFDKGRRLKVPEVVPFRLTPMLQDALGFTGVEGKFRVALEVTLRVLCSKDVRETVLMLFEAFVYSPLVDWVDEEKRQGRSGDLKDRLEVGVNLSLFLSRAEERRQDTVFFARQYEQIADALTRLLNDANVSYVALLGHCERLRSFEQEEHVLEKEISNVKTELSACGTAQSVRYEELDRVVAQMKAITSEVTSFAMECYAKHQKIESWRQKRLTLAKTYPANVLHDVTRASDGNSFQAACATLCEILARSACSSQQRNTLAELESKCRSLDADLKVQYSSFEEFATDLIPYLSAYIHWQSELQSYEDSENKTSPKDVYWMWWTRCTEFLGTRGDDNHEETIVASSYNGQMNEDPTLEPDSCRQKGITLQRGQEVTWQTLETETMELPQAVNLSSDEVVASLSSQLSPLNALIANQRIIKTNMLEAMQQMDTLASALSVAPCSGLESRKRWQDCVQACSSNASALFDYTQTLADLVEGICEVEASCAENKMKLDVNSAGKNLLENAFEASKKVQACRNAVSELDARMRTLCDELGHKKDAYNTLVSTKRTAEAEFRKLCGENKSTLVETSRRLSTHVVEMRKLLQRFDKTSPKQCVLSASEADSVRTQQVEKETTSATSSSLWSISEYFFLENDRLVKLLLRSIRPVTHLQMLEGVLERHGGACSALRDTVARIDQALTHFAVLAEQVQAETFEADAQKVVLLLYNLSAALGASSTTKDCGTADVGDDDVSFLLMEGRDLVRKCVQLFFEATDMAGRLSKSAEDAVCSVNESIGTPHGNDEQDEEQHTLKESVAGDSKSKVVVDEAIATHRVEEKSHYGLQVVKRIENKLSGIVTETNPESARLTVEQQVTWLIDEAVKTDNLCVMYEGWTPWI